jgi:Xaa-Pro aminopeptidase
LRMPEKDVLMVPEFELSRAERASALLSRRRALEVVSPDRLKRGLMPDRRFSAWAVGLLKREGIVRVKVGPDFPVGVADRLRRFKIKVEVVHENLVPEREVKSPDEVRRILEVLQATVIAMRRAIDTIRMARADTANGLLKLNGRALHAEDVQDLVHRTLIEHHCVCRDTIVACGRQGADPHECGRGPLVANELIVLDIFPEHMHHGYWGDMTRTVVRGPASSRMKAMYRAVIAAQVAGLAQVQPKASGRTIHKVVVAELEKRRFKSGKDGLIRYGFTHSTGHGVGLDVHEAPAIGWAPTRLREGNVITIEPGLYYPDIGGVRIEDTVLVTQTGWRHLVPCEKTLEI